MNLLRTSNVAERLGISLRQVQTLIKQGKLPAEKFGRDYIIKEQDLQSFERRPVGRPPLTESVKPVSSTPTPKKRKPTKK